MNIIDPDIRVVSWTNNTAKSVKMASGYVNPLMTLSEDIPGARKTQHRPTTKMSSMSWAKKIWQQIGLVGKISILNVYNLNS